MRRLWLVVLVIVALLVTACGTPTSVPAMEAPVQQETEAPEKTQESEATQELEKSEGQISVAGSTTVQPLAEKLAEVYTAKHSDIKIDVAGGGSSAGVKAAGEGTTDIGAASREVKDSEKETYPDIKIFVIARDGIAIVAHPEVPVDELTTDQVRGIFAGTIVNWNEVGGDDQPITVISREEGSGTRGAFEEMVMGEDTAITDKAIFQDSNGKVRTAVASTPNAIAYLSFGYLDDSVLAIAIDGVEPTEANALNGIYPIVRPLNMITRGEPAGVVKAWIDWILSEEGQAIVKDQGYISVLAGAAVEEPVTTPEPEKAEGQISVAGSTTVQPLAEKLAEVYIAANPDMKVDVAGGGSSAGVKAAGDGTADIGAASREVKDSEKETYPDIAIFVIARDGIAIVVHPEVPVDELTTDQVRDIFAGAITNWSEVGGENQPITVISREEGSGTRGAFEEMVMGEEAVITDKAIFQDSNGKVRTAVASTPNSIAYLSFGYLDDSVVAVAIDGVEATEANALNGIYPIVRPLNMITKGEPAGVVKAWIDWILSEEGQAIVKDQGYISVLGGEVEALSGQISVAGSTTVQPLAEKMAEVFIGMYPDVKIDVAGGGSSAGVKAAGDGTADIGAASREVKDSEKETYPDIKIFVIAWDGIAIVVHPEVPVDELTKDQVRDIFAGTIVNWSEVGGENQPITVISREEGSGTRGAFEEMVMGEEAAITDKAIFQDSNGKVRTAVASTPNSIAYLSFGYLDDSVVAIAIDGVEATTENALNGTYPIVRPLNMITKGEPVGVIKAWLDWILSEGQTIVEDQGYLPIQ
ncbi:MAG: phosphate ABC transporter substrate-binding protein [Anaerolineae bacterium]|nr:phosphate ABC transporter substrate-binding protein [Anaerolineae bacterium]